MSKFHRFAAVLPALFFALITIHPSAYSVIPVVMALVGLVFLPKTFRLLADKEVRLLSFGLLVYWLIYLFSYFYHGERLSSIDLPSRSLLAAFSLLVMVRYPPKLSWVMYGIACGSVITGLIAFYQAYVLHMRAFLGFGYMVIQIGGICAWLGMLSAVGYIYFARQKMGKSAGFALLGTTMGLAACFLSGARGAWVFTPVVAMGVLWIGYLSLNKKLTLALLAAWSLALVACLPQIESRFYLAVNELQSYDGAKNTLDATGLEVPLDSNQPEDAEVHQVPVLQSQAVFDESEIPDDIPIEVSSSGIRIELWKSALYTALDYPLFGYGHERLDEEKQRQIDRGLVDPIVLTGPRAHNQYLEELQTKGLLGLLGLTLMFAMPFFYYVKNMLPRAIRRDQPELFFASMLGTVHVLMVAGFCLTQHYLNHHSGILMFAFGTAIFSAQVITLSSSRRLHV
ncbi:O-antigen ligase family protein [Vibrio fluvialis]|uniref:O-antigen ligase family protein n=1 Tax=Vibrio fluvialis TaxID=676 RepID=UPI00192C7DCF|nr:O-antigen ligase family protein [Vibrio fluvialis]MBL4280015.1 O-antigen ligase family protein [Vibrio fluvialis]